ncbi:MAG: hypothetical protein ACI8V2_000592 [Candidatus Latescibacterota bacterium]|jgi:hypothetical protein
MRPKHRIFRESLVIGTNPVDHCLRQVKGAIDFEPMREGTDDALLLTGLS